VAQGQHHPDRPIEARNVVAEGSRSRHDRRFSGEAGEVGQAAESVRDVREAGPAAIRAGLPVARDAQHDEAGIHRAQRRPAEAPLLHPAGAEVLNKHVRLGDQLLEQLDAFRAAQINRNRLLVARFRQPAEGRVMAFCRGAEPAHRIAGDRMLDLEDLRAELTEDGGSVRSGEKRSDVDDPDPRERRLPRCLLRFVQRSGRRLLRLGDPDRFVMRRIGLISCHDALLGIIYGSSVSGRGHGFRCPCHRLRAPRREPGIVAPGHPRCVLSGLAARKSIPRDRLRRSRRSTSRCPPFADTQIERSPGDHCPANILVPRRWNADPDERPTRCASGSGRPGSGRRQNHCRTGTSSLPDWPPWRDSR
jgi:hypothetical protein